MTIIEDLERRILGYGDTRSLRALLSVAAQSFGQLFRVELDLRRYFEASPEDKDVGELLGDIDAFRSVCTRAEIAITRRTFYGRRLARLKAGRSGKRFLRRRNFRRAARTYKRWPKVRGKLRAGFDWVIYGGKVVILKKDV